MMEINLKKYKKQKKTKNIPMKIENKLLFFYFGLYWVFAFNSIIPYRIVRPINGMWK